MNRREVLKVIGGVAAVPIMGTTTTTSSENKNLPVAQYRREVGEDMWYMRTHTDRTPVSQQRIVRDLVNADEIMGMEYEYIGDNSTFADEGPVCRLTKFMRRHGRCWINKEDAEYLLHPKTMKPVKTWGEVEMAETLILTKSGVMGNKGVFDTGRTVGFTDKTQCEEQKWIWDHRRSCGKWLRNEQDAIIGSASHEFNFYREDCVPERLGNVQQLYYKMVYHDGKGDRSIVYSLCGPVEGGKWRTDWTDKETALMVNMLDSIGVKMFSDVDGKWDVEAI